jgi:hypothetical protein
MSGALFGQRREVTLRLRGRWRMREGSALARAHDDLEPGHDGPSSRPADTQIDRSFAAAGPPAIGGEQTNLGRA